MRINNLRPWLADSQRAEQDGGGRSRQLRVLCAEDHEITRELLKQVLSEAGHEVVGVSDGQAAWTHLARDPDGFDAVVTDHQMPGLTGLELVKCLREIAFSGRIIVQSGMLTDEIERAYRAMGVDHVVHKPVLFKVIVGLVVGVG